MFNWVVIHSNSRDRLTCAKARRPARTYIQQLCEDTGCCPEDLPRAMNDREKWRERVRDIRATSTTWWWWWWMYMYKPDLALNNLKWLICHKTKPNHLGYCLRKWNWQPEFKSWMRLFNILPMVEGLGKYILGPPAAFKSKVSISTNSVTCNQSQL